MVPKDGDLIRNAIAIEREREKRMSLGGVDKFIENIVGPSNAGWCSSVFPISPVQHHHPALARSCKDYENGPSQPTVPAYTNDSTIGF